MNKDEVLKAVHKRAEDCWPEPVRCSLLGVVPVLVIDGESVSGIPTWLVREARAQDLEVVASDFRSNTYTFKLKQRN